MSSPPLDSTDPDYEHSALLFLNGQYALRYLDERAGLQVKWLAPEAVRAAFSRIGVDSGWLPPEVRRWGHTPRGEYAVMFVPAQKHTLRLVNTWEGRVPSKRLLKIDVPLPALVFAGIGTTYCLWACRTVPRPEAAAHVAPLPNVGRDGHICFGDNHPPSAGPDTLTQAWKIFMSSPFNDHLIGDASRAYPRDVREQLLALAESRADTYPVDDLVRYRTGTIHEAVQQMLASGER